MIDHNRTYKTFPCLSCGQERASGRWVRELSRANDVRAGFICLACDWGRPDIGSVVSREIARRAERMQAKKDRLVLLIAAGWGDVPGNRIPADVIRDAEAGKLPRRNAKKRGNDNWKVRMEESAA